MPSVGSWMPRRLPQRALLILGALTLLAMGLLYPVLVQRQNTLATDAAQHWAEVLARSAAAASAQALAQGDRAAMERVLRQLAALPGVRSIDMVDATDRPVLSIAQDAQGGVRRQRDVAQTGGGEETLQAWAPLGDGARLGRIGVRLAVHGEHARLDRLGFEVLAAVATVGLLLMAAAYAWLSRAMAPLARLMDFARTLPSQPGVQTTWRTGALELKELAEALNEASSRLNHRLADVQAREQGTLAIVRGVPEALIGIDEQGLIVTASPAVHSVFGQCPEALTGCPLHQLLPGLDAAELARRTPDPGACGRSGGPHVVRFESLATRPGGTAFPVAVSLSRAETEVGVRYVCTVRDLTEQRRSEQMLHLYSQALECTSNGVVISDLSLPGQPVFYANPAFYRITGYDPGEAIGRNCAFLQGDDTAQPQIEEVRAAVRERRAVTVVLRNYRKDGSLFFNELAIAPVGTAGGEVRHYVGIVNDVTERERAQLAIAERSARLNAVFDLSPDGFVVFDREGQLVFSNRAFLGMTGWEDGLALQGLGMAEFDRRMGQLADAAVSYPELSNLGGGDGFETMDLLHLSLPRPRVLTRLVRHNAGGQGESILYFRDVTHETEVDRMKSEFLTTAAHELRTPMVSVFGFTELLLNRPVPESKRRDVLQTIHRQSSLLINMVNELLDLARIEARQGKDLQREAQPLGPLVEAVVAGLQGHDAARPVQVALPHADQQLVVDAEKFQRALGNVLSNAFKYSPGGGVVSLTSISGDIDGVAAVGLRVADQGIGMTESECERVFERFYRADPSGNIPGTGLGMSLVKEILDLHGGRADVASRPGRGTTVTLWFPLATVSRVNPPVAAAAA
ncbi:MAG: PAS domain S-box protein [Burkholderiaceae bacterium]|nr:PAS domain S-box protein [Rhodoferax sp.]MCP5287460.1 PAS domain S-box protein [Burkholderiaceae bacterium]